MLRALEITDADAAAALIRAGFAGQVVNPPPSAARETGESIAAALAAGGGFGVEAADGELIAVVLWQEAEGGLYLGRLAVAESARGKGMARALLGAVEALARHRGLSFLHLKVRLPLLDNRAMFRACGFVETTLHAHPGHAAPTYCVMEKRLTQ